MRIRAFAVGVSLALVVLGTLTLGPGMAQAEPLSLTMMSIRAIPNVPALLVPQYAGRFELNVKSLEATNPSDEIAALVRGDVDLFFATASTAIAARDQGHPLVVIMGGARKSTQMVAAKKLGLPADGWDKFKAAAQQAKASGQKLKLGAVTAASTNYVECYFELKRHGIDPAQDLEIVNVPFPQQAAGLQTGQVDMICSPDPFATRSIESGAGTLFALPYGTAAGDILGAVMTTRANLENPTKREAMKRFVKTMKFVIGQMKADPNVVVGHIATLAGVDQATAKKMAGNVVYDVSLDAKEVGAVAKMHFELGQTKKDWSCCVKDYVDDQLLK